MIQTDHLCKNYGVGKTCCIFNFGGYTGTIFTKSNFFGYYLKCYTEYLLNYVKFSKVYILINSEDKPKICSEYNHLDIIYGVQDQNLLLKYNIDELFSLSPMLAMFGGKIHKGVVQQSIVLGVWKKYNPNKIIYVSQDDPIQKSINVIPYLRRRLIGDNVSKLKIVNHENAPIDKFLEYYDYIYSIFSNPIIAYVGNDYQKFYDQLNKTGKYEKRLNATIDYWCKFNIWTYVTINDFLELKFANYDFNNKKYDCVYYGFSKDNKRAEITCKFYNQLDNKFLLIGGKLSKFGYKYFIKEYDYLNTLSYHDLLIKLGESSKSTLVLANKNSYNNFISPRYFETMLSDLVAFVYLPYDKDKIYTDDDVLKEFMYVQTPEEFNQKVSLISNNEQLYKEIVYRQRMSILNKFKNYIDESNIDKYNQMKNAGI